MIHDLNLAARFSHWMIAMREGKVLYEGTAEAVMTREVLADVFSLDAYVDKDPWTGRPMCVTYRIKPVYSKDCRNQDLEWPMFGMLRLYFRTSDVGGEWA